MQISAQGTAFIAAHEGYVSKAYRCPAGVITIGYGFTNGSRAFAEFWQRRHGRALRMGDSITRAEADRILAELLNREYGAAVTTKVRTTLQHQWDAATSVAFNCGTGSLVWRWALALARGAVKESATLLRTTAVTANGRRLAGLVRRRAAEARLIECGDYGKGATAAAPSVSTNVADVKWLQQSLVKLGYAVDVDGVSGPKTVAAVRAFQKAHGLKIDGLVGPATRATIIRALDAKAQAKTSAGTGTAVGAGEAGVDATTAPVDASTADIALSALYWGAGAAAIVLVIFLIYRYRGRFTGRRVPT